MNSQKGMSKGRCGLSWNSRESRVTSPESEVESGTD
jgi:hypothetical protein